MVPLIISVICVLKKNVLPQDRVPEEPTSSSWSPNEESLSTASPSTPTPTSRSSLALKDEMSSKVALLPKDLLAEKEALSEKDSLARKDQLPDKLLPEESAKVKVPAPARVELHEVFEPLPRSSMLVDKKSILPKRAVLPRFVASNLRIIFKRALNFWVFLKVTFMAAKNVKTFLFYSYTLLNVGFCVSCSCFLKSQKSSIVTGTGMITCFCHYICLMLFMIFLISARAMSPTDSRSTRQNHLHRLQT